MPSSTSYRLASHVYAVALYEPSFMPCMFVATHWCLVYIEFDQRHDGMGLADIGRPYQAAQCIPLTVPQPESSATSPLLQVDWASEFG